MVFKVITVRGREFLFGTLWNGVVALLDRLAQQEKIEAFTVLDLEGWCLRGRIFHIDGMRAPYALLVEVFENPTPDDGRINNYWVRDLSAETVADRALLEDIMRDLACHGKARRILPQFDYDTTGLAETFADPDSRREFEQAVRAACRDAAPIVKKLAELKSSGNGR